MILTFGYGVMYVLSSKPSTSPVVPGGSELVFAEEERSEFELHGLLRPSVATLHEQVDRRLTRSDNCRTISCARKQLELPWNYSQSIWWRGMSGSYFSRYLNLLATRKPKFMSRFSGLSPKRKADRRPSESWRQEPPRTTRDLQSTDRHSEPSVGAPL
jgi:hypothetical protein